jgi:hypothetical protein
MLEKMEEGDWLYNYRFEKNIGYSMRNVLNKAKYLNIDIPVHEAFLKNKDFLQECYDDFFLIYWNTPKESMHFYSSKINF